MPGKRHVRPKAKDQEDMSLDAIRKMRERRMEEIRASVLEGPVATRLWL